MNTGINTGILFPRKRCKMSSVADVTEVLSKIEECIQNTNVDISDKCREAREYFENADGLMDECRLESVQSFLEDLLDSLPSFTKADTAKLLNATVKVISSISAFTGLGGPAVPIICGVLSKVFTAFGGNAMSVGKVVEEAIQKTFSGQSMESLHEQAKDLHCMYRLIFGFLNPTNEKTQFSKHDITNMNIQMNVLQGATFLRKLGKLIVELAKEEEGSDPDIKREKAKTAMDFIELYITLASLRDMILIQFYTITNSTAHSQHLAGGVQRVIGSFDEQDREVLSLFLNPTKEHAYIVSSVREEEQELLMRFLEMKNLLPKESWIVQEVCEFWSVKHPKYHAIRLRSDASFFRGGDLRYIRGTKEEVGPESLFSFRKVERTGNYVYITPKGAADSDDSEFLTMTKGSNKWIMSLKGPPGPESEWKVIKLDNKNYVFSPRGFPDYFMSMSKLLDGSAAGLLGCLRRRCQWVIKSHR
ncbi:toxin CqTX-A-like [Argopecten irradians]|uniref:toxin CqTX-A-like n=1 Tax=Argopecten irradians TaxID=31199 RepID=UPI003720C9C6